MSADQMGTKQPAAAAAAATAGADDEAARDIIGKCLPLYSPADQTHLSPLVCLMRSQLEVFAATPADVADRATVGGLARPITVGRVGLRCVHCRHLPIKEQSKGSVGYPAEIRIFNQSTRNFQRFHFGKCPLMPQSVRDEFERLTTGKRSHSSKASQEYWIRRCREMGLVDVGVDMGQSSGIAALGVAGVYFEEDALRMGLKVVPPDESRGASPGAGASSSSDRDVTGGRKTTRKKKKEKTSKPKTMPKSKSSTATKKISSDHHADTPESELKPPAREVVAGSVPSMEDLDSIPLDFAAMMEEDDGNNGDSLTALLDFVDGATCSAADEGEHDVEGSVDPPLGLGGSVAGAGGSAIAESSTTSQSGHLLRNDVNDMGSTSPLVYPLDAIGTNSEAPPIPIPVPQGFNALGHCNPQQDCSSSTVGAASPVTSRVDVASSHNDGGLPDPLFPAAASRTGNVLGGGHSSDIVSRSSTSGRDASLGSSSGSAHRPQRDELLSKLRLATFLVQAAGEITPLPSPHPNNDDIGRETQLDDLYALGIELYELFSGKRPFDEGGGEAAAVAAAATTHTDVGVNPRHYEEIASAKRSKSRQDSVAGGPAYVPLVELGVPSCISVLVSALIDCRPGNEKEHSGKTIDPPIYASLEQVEKDLDAISQDPDRFLSEESAGDGHLDIYDHLFGQETNQDKIMKAYERTMKKDRSSLSSPCEVVLISGLAGSGKSSLGAHCLRQLSKAHEAGHLRFLAGKFDERTRNGSRPLSALVDAFNDHCGLIVEVGGEVLRRARDEIIHSIGDDVGDLVDLIPRLRDVLGVQASGSVSSSHAIRGKEAQRRVSFLMKKLLRALSDVSGELVLFVDDIQFADIESLQLLQGFVSDHSLARILFIFTYRSEAVDVNCEDDNSEFSQQLREIITSGATITACAVEPLSTEEINDLVSSTLRLPPHLVEPLSALAYQKTAGNAFFVIQFLISVCDEGLLEYSARNRRWEYRSDEILAFAVADSVVSLLSAKMLRLTPDVQTSLQIASCLGSRSDEKVLHVLDSEFGSNFHILAGLAVCLDLAVEEGLMFKSGTAYTFAHDRIRESAYSLIPEDDRNNTHLRIARTLMKTFEPHDLSNDSLLFVIADQILEADLLINLMLEKDERTNAVGFLLAAGKRCLSSAAALLPAVVYLQKAIDLISPTEGSGSEIEQSWWSEQYDMSLELYTSLGEAQYVLGNHQDVSTVSQIVLSEARSIEDKLRVYYVLIDSMAAQGKIVVALQFGIGVLSQLGENLPSSDEELTQEMVEKYVGETMALLGKEGGPSGLLEWALMEDASQIAKMKLLSQLFTLAFLASPRVYAILSCRMIQITLSGGVCKESSTALATMGAMLCKSPITIEKGYQFGKVALALVEKLEAREYLAQVYSTCYSLVNLYIEPIQACADSIRYGYEVAIAMGNYTQASYCAVSILLHSIVSGRPLGVLAKEVESFPPYIREGNYGGIVLSIWEQTMLNLLLSSSDSDPTVLVGRATGHKDLMVEARVTNNEKAIGQIFVARLFLSYLFSRYGAAVDIILERRQHPVKLHAAPLMYETLFGALSCLAAPHKLGREESRTMAQDALKKMQTWQCHSKWNFQHRATVLQAEIALFDGNLQEAAARYDEAVAQASKHGFVHEKAIILERSAMFHRQYNANNGAAVAEECMARALLAYEKWGAKAKIGQLAERASNASQSGGVIDSSGFVI